MTLEKATEILADSAYNGSTTFNSNFRDALKLGIEALKRLQENRHYAPPQIPRPLPGETEE
ncbi:hypothetical protein ES703_108762 [subsurface metagenome]